MSDQIIYRGNILGEVIYHAYEDGEPSGKKGDLKLIMENENSLGVLYGLAVDDEIKLGGRTIKRGQFEKEILEYARQIEFKKNNNDYGDMR